MGQIYKAVECEECKESFNYSDEVVYFNGEFPIYDTEKYPDWTNVYCNGCAEEKNLV